MAIPSGLGAQLGISTESAFGTYTAPTTFLEFTSESLRLAKEYIRTAGLRGGRLIQSENLHVATTRAVAGDVTLDVQDQGFGKIFNMLHGNTVTPTALTGGLFRQTHNIGLTAPTGKSLGIQVGRPDVGGTANPFSYLGCKIVSAVFTLATSGVVTLTFTVDGVDERTDQSLGAATYATSSVPFNFISGAVEFDDVAFADCVTQATITIPLTLKTDRYCIGSAVKKEQIPNAIIAPTVALDMEFTSLTQHTAFRNATRRKVELNCTGTTTSGTYTSALNFTAASTIAVGEGPVVEGPDTLMQSITFEVVDNGIATAPLVIEYVSADSAL